MFSILPNVRDPRAFRRIYQAMYFPIRIPIQDTRLHDHWTWIYVGLDGDILRGYVVAHAAGGPYFGLPYYIRLQR